MPLPEHEERQLQEIEQALYRDDPKFGRRMRASDPQVRYKRKLIAPQLGFVIGVGLLPAGAVTHRAAVPGVGGGQLAAARGQGPARGFRGRDHHRGGHEAPDRPHRAGPDDETNARALASPPGG